MAVNENKSYNENAVSTLKTLSICLKGMLSIIPKNRTPELTQAISVCRKQINNSLRVKYTNKPKKAIQPFNGYNNHNNNNNNYNNDIIKKKQSSLLTAALLAASKENTNLLKKTTEESNLNNESKIISISIPSNSLRLGQDFSIEKNKNRNNDNDNNNSNNLNILSSSNSSISIPIEISNNSISLPKNSFKNKGFFSSKKEPYLCTCSNDEKKYIKQKLKSLESSNIEIETKKMHNDKTSDSNSKFNTRSKSEPRVETEVEQTLNNNSTKIKKSHSFVPFFSISSYLSSNSKNSKEKNKITEKEKLDDNKDDSNKTNNTNNNSDDNDENDNNDNNNESLFPSKYFISIPNRKGKIEIPHSLPDLVLDKPTTSTSNSFTLSSLNPSSTSKFIPISSSKLYTGSIIEDTNINLTEHYEGKSKKPDIPKVPIMKYSLSSQESLKFNEHLYNHQNEENNNIFNDEESELIKPTICEYCGGIIKYPKQSLINDDQSLNIDDNEKDITVIKSNNKDNVNNKYNQNEKNENIENKDKNNEKSLNSLVKKKEDMKINIDKSKPHINDISPVNNQNILNINHITSILSESTVLTVSDANDENFLDLVIITASQKNGLFSKLPVELIIYIFSFFRSQSDLLSLTLVNRAIGACAKTLLCGLPRLPDNDHMKKFFKVAVPSNRSLLNCVRSLQLPDIKQDILPKDFSSIYPPLLSNLQHISFYINEDKQDTFNESFFLTMFKEFHQLRSVCLANRSRSVTDACIKELIRNNPFLNVLDLENIDQLSDEAFIGLSEHYQLQVLSLGNCTKITDKTLFNLSSSPDILYLSVDNCWRVNDEGIKRFAETHSLVKVFRAYGCANLTDTSVSELGKYCKNLEVIDIGGTLITDVAIISLAEGCPNLVMLQIDENGDLTNKSIAVIGASCKKLESIYLPDQITDDGVIPIAQNCKELQEITLDCLSITDYTLEALAQCSELECISIRGCTDITEKGIEYLTKHCKLLYKIYMDDETNLNEKKLSKRYITRKSPQDFVGCRCSCKEFPNFIVEHEP
ncbi:RNI-like protein [Neocallimastix californiae]|uniref:RNI-like protein n=1 Tax=Neocallimastix californiae TaxID=1754190 RepID=A0A1Y1ZFK2_9FUNG|nr:RNI-like protein [Neocallimastix californiae]|eukprot:ORY08625.1 RNI-like protein [Neocallimastix californiae]